LSLNQLVLRFTLHSGKMKLNSSLDYREGSLQFDSDSPPYHDQACGNNLAADRDSLYRRVWTDRAGSVCGGGQLWGQGESYALSTLGDASKGLRLMIKAVTTVSRIHGSADNYITNLSAYLFQTYKHLVLAELEKENGHRQRETERQTDIESLSISLAEDVDRKILVQQIVRRMDDWMREVFELLMLGHSFEEIGKLRGLNAHVLRTKFNRHLRRLTKQIQSDK
jgi:hypothetical protein